MADLSGVLRKTIDGLPRATPQLRAKVYDKARAAIRRQVESANPPLADDVVDARMAALEDAIARTEAHYEAEEDSADGAPAGGATAPSGASAQGSAPVSRQNGEPSTSRTSVPAPAVEAEARAAGSERLEARSRAGGEATPASSGSSARKGSFPPFMDEPGPKRAYGEDDAPEPGEQPYFPISSDDGPDSDRPASVGAPFAVPGRRDRSGPSISSDDEAWNAGRLPAGIRSDDDFIPEADVSAPRYGSSRRRSGSSGFGKIAAACVVLLVIGGLGAVGWSYRDDIEGFLVAPEGLDTLASNGAANAPAGVATPESAGGEDETAGETPGAKEAAAPQAGTPTQTAANPPASTREFTQRLLPDGTEVDNGPAKKIPNAFDEGTNVAAASPPEDGSSKGATPTISSAINEQPQTVDDGEAGDVPGTAEPQAQSGEAAADAGASDALPKVAQEAVFYQEKTEDAPGTQETGDVVWSLVNEPPSEGEPAEPAIRAVAKIPDEDLTMTMTIRRNADPTLPASHVIELMFDTPSNFAGQNVANVQRLALKSTEQARGEPLIGVAGKISDGFFIIALNNLDQAMQSNMALLRNQKWIDIPIAYATGRRALMSIEKGAPGEKVFAEAMDAWKKKG